jgi:GntR family transcriptional regulator of arabinose operon
VQVKTLVLEMIHREGLQSGARLPTEGELSERFNVSRNTVRQAIGELVVDGIVTRHQGRGTFYRGEVPSETEESAGLIGVVTPLARSYIFGDIIHGMDDYAHENGYSLVLASTNADPNRELEALRNILEKPIEGLIIEFARSSEIDSNVELTRILRECTVPIVVCDAETPMLNASYVTVDDLCGSRAATRYLLDKGHRRIALVYKKPSMAGIKRRDGFLQTLKDAGIEPDPDLIRPYDVQEDLLPAYRIVKDLLGLENGKRPTAIFFFNDQCAVQSYAAVAEAGLNVPDDVSFMGYDDSELARNAVVPLTTMRHPKYRLGWLAARTLLERIKANPPFFVEETLIRPTLVERDSVRECRDE